MIWKLFSKKRKQGKFFSENVLKNVNNIKISDHFNLKEFECRGKNCCGGAVKVHPRLVEGLEKLRFVLQGKYPKKRILIVINCGYRCRKHNSRIGGSKESEHIYGLAADINTAILGLPEIEVAKIAAELKDEKGKPYFRRIGVYGKSYLKNGKLELVRGYHNKVGFIHVGVADKFVDGKKLPERWGDWR